MAFVDSRHLFSPLDFLRLTLDIFTLDFLLSTPDFLLSTFTLDSRQLLSTLDI